MILLELPSTQRLVEWSPRVTNIKLEIPSKAESLRPPSRQRPPRMPSFKMDKDGFLKVKPVESQCVKDCKSSCKISID